jgi:hypothetical protein
LLDQLTDSLRFPSAFVAAGLRGNDPLIGPPADVRIRHGGDILGDLLGHPISRRRPQYRREAAVGRPHRPVIQNNSGEQGGGHRQSGEPRPPRSRRGVEFLLNRIEHPRSQLGRRAARMHPTESRTKIVIHSRSSAI